MVIFVYVVTKYTEIQLFQLMMFPYTLSLWRSFCLICRLRSLTSSFPTIQENSGAPQTRWSYSAWCNWCDWWEKLCSILQLGTMTGHQSRYCVSPGVGGSSEQFSGNILLVWWYECETEPVGEEEFKFSSEEGDQLDPFFSGPSKLSWSKCCTLHLITFIWQF